VSDSPEPTLYDELGVDPGASVQELRAGYRRQARRLHPDVAVGAGESSSGDAMRRLNEVWAVLGDPERRRRYDESRVRVDRREPGPAPEKPTIGDDAEPVVGPRLPFLRPSALVLVVLAIIFVVTAYAGSWPGSTPGPSATTVGAGGPTAGSVIGQCVAGVPLGPVGAPAARVVACSAPNDGQILAEVTTAAQCPAGTVGYAGSQSGTILCAVTTHGEPASP